MTNPKLSKTFEGYLELELTSDKVSYDDFGAWCREFLKRYGGKTLEKIDGPDCRVRRVNLLGQELKLVFFDFPLMTVLIAETQPAECVLKAIAELEQHRFG